jgi:hypothetical protein
MDRFKIRANFTGFEAENILGLFNDMLENLHSDPLSVNFEFENTSIYNGDAGGYVELLTTDPVDAFVMLFSIPGAFPN